MNREIPALLSHLDKHEFDKARIVLGQIDALRDEFMEKIDAVRSGHAEAGLCRREPQSSATSIGRSSSPAIVTALAAAIGLAFAIVVSGGITRPVQQLLQARPRR